MRTDQFASLAAAIVVGGGTLLAASGADAISSYNGIQMQGMSMQGMSLNALSLNGNGVPSNAAESQGFDFNNVSAWVLTWTWDCPLPLDRRAVFCGIGTSPKGPFSRTIGSSAQAE
jgi:hypothetical protein